ncbi:hypothetical protein [Caballeronia sp. Lep1P3]|uniref:hypothetical protein n=1 Tax=Caballeronia sp. Lep1P3 TaxID=2878150 RepID=UPI001FD3390C|nr:hypothetical protein [Caballeronia sp. Lep1P3]
MSTGHDDLDAWKRQRTVALAFELADSGRCEHIGDIAYALQFEHGLASAQALIDDADMRRRLNERCANARDALLPEPAESPEPPEPPEPETLPQTDAAAKPEPSTLRRTASALWRSAARAAKADSIESPDLNSAAS